MPCVYRLRQKNRCSLDEPNPFGRITPKPSMWIPTQNLTGHFSGLATKSGVDEGSVKIELSLSEQEPSPT